MSDSQPASRASDLPLWGLALLGVFYLVALVALLVAGLIACFRAPAEYRQVTLRLGIPLLGGLLVLVVRSIWVRLDAPEGHPVSPAVAPRLFEEIEAVRSRLGGPRIDSVILTPDFNAAVTELPTYALVGPSRRYLLLGLPLFECLGPEELRAVLGHELAHLTRRHTHGSAWLARLEVGWIRLAASLEASTFYGFLFRPFYQWYIPRYREAVTARSRDNEFESDALAARVVPAERVGASLVRTEVMAQLLARGFWREVYGQSATLREPPRGVIQAAATTVREPVDPGTVERLLHGSARFGTVHLDSHPTTLGRIVALGLVPPSAAAPAVAARLFQQVEPEAAATAWLEPAAHEELRKAVDWNWGVAIGGQWREWHRLALLATNTDLGPDHPDVRLAAAQWEADCGPWGRTLADATQRIAAFPDDDDLAFSFGTLLLRGDDPAAIQQGVALLEKVGSRNSTKAIAALQALEPYYRGAGDDLAAARCSSRSQALDDLALRSLAEHLRLSPTDRLAAVSLNPYWLAELAKVLQRHASIDEAFLIRKQATVLTDEPIVMLAITTNTPWYRLESAATAEVVNRIVDEVVLPRGTWPSVVPVERKSAIAKRLRRIEGARCYHAGAVEGARVTSVGAFEEPSFGDRVGGHRLPWLIGVGFIALGVLITLLPSRPRRQHDLSALRGAVRQHPADAGAHFALGRELARRDDLALALPEFRQAVALDSNNAASLHALAWTLDAMHQADAALPLYERAAQLAPGDAELVGNYGYALAEQRRGQEALVQLRRAAALAPGNAFICRTLARVALGEARYAEALRALRRSADLAPKEAADWAIRGYAAFLVNSHEEAAWALARAREIDPAIEGSRELPFSFREIAATLDREGMDTKTARRSPPAFRELTAADSVDDDKRQGMRNDAMARNAERLTSATSITVQPTDTTLVVGDSLPMGAIRLELRDADGKVLEGVYPRVRLAGTALGIRPGGVLFARTEGTDTMVFAIDTEGRTTAKAPAMMVIRVRRGR